jgi:hypothetical protein
LNNYKKWHPKSNSGKQGVCWRLFCTCETDKLQAVNQLAQNFVGYKNIPKIENLQKSITAIKMQLNNQIIAEFSRFPELNYFVTPYSYMENPLSVSPNLLSDACIAIDSFGVHAK